MEVYLLDGETASLLPPLKSKTTSSHVYKVQQGLGRQALQQNVGLITLERSPQSPSTHPYLQNTNKHRVYSQILVSSSDKKTDKNHLLFWGEPLLRNKSNSGEAEACRERNTSGKTIMNIFREMRRIIPYMKQKEGTIKKNIQRTKMSY